MSEMKFQTKKCHVSFDRIENKWNGNWNSNIHFHIISDNTVY